MTNYFIYDWMDFDPNLSRDESLWKGYAPTEVRAENGDVLITVPYQKQVLQDDMLADLAEPQLSLTLVLRAYGDHVVRMFTSMVGDTMSNESEMLSLHPEMQSQPLHTQEIEVGLIGIFDAHGRRRAQVDLRPGRLDWWSDLQPAAQPEPRITLFPDGNLDKPISLKDDHFSPPRYDGLALGFCRTEGQPDRATITLAARTDECFVGTGERFRKMDLSGQTFYLKNQDGQGVNNRRAYKNIPFFMSSRGYGVFFHTSAYCRLSLADHSSRAVQMRNDRATLDVFFMADQSPERILYRYRQLTGFPPMLPLWSFGIWMSRMTYFSADEVEEICQRLRHEDYPCDVIHLDTGWFRTDWLCEWKFNPERFPDPRGFLKRLSDDGFQVSLWQLPYVAQGAEQIDEARREHYISQPQNAAQEESTGGASNFSTLDYAGTIDFSYPKATEWYKGLLRQLLDMGVKCIKTDFGENIHMDHIYHAATPEQLNNIYALLYQKAAYEVTREVTGDGIVWARSAWAGCQRYPLHWGGDSESSWEGLAGSLRGGLHFGLSGFAFWSHDVPGFHSTPNFMNSVIDPEVYVRWTQFGVFSSHMRYHGTMKREPWHYPTIADTVRMWWRVRYRLLPYLVEESLRATQTGYPVLQALLMHHPDDPVCWHVDTEYYFGTKLLVCPVMDASRRRDIYLPEGEWQQLTFKADGSIVAGKMWPGGRWFRDVEVPLDQMPVFCRPGTELSLYPDLVQHTGQMDLNRAVKVKF